MIVYLCLHIYICFSRRRGMVKVIGITMKTLWAIGEFSARAGDTGQGAIVAGHLLGIWGGEFGFLGEDFREDFGFS